MHITLQNVIHPFENMDFLIRAVKLQAYDHTTAHVKISEPVREIGHDTTFPYYLFNRSIIVPCAFLLQILLKGNKMKFTRTHENGVII